jgi:HEAT repeat protein
MGRIATIGVLVVGLLITATYFISRGQHGPAPAQMHASDTPTQAIEPVPAIIPEKKSVTPLLVSPLDSSDPSLVAFVTTPVDAKSQATRIEPDFTAKVTSLSTKEEFDAVVAVLRNKDDEDTARNEAANLLRRTHYDRLDDELLTLLDRSDETPRMRFFFVQHIGNGLEKADKARAHLIEARLQKALTDRDVFVRREALRLLAMRGNEEATKMVAVSLRDPSQGEWRDLIIRLSIDLGQDRRDEIRGCLTDADEKVRVIAIAALGMLRDGESRAPIEAIANAKTTSFRERRAAEQALTQLQSEGF